MSVHESKETFAAYMRERRKNRPDRASTKKYRLYIQNKIKESARILEIAQAFKDECIRGTQIVTANNCRKMPAPGA